MASQRSKSKNKAVPKTKVTVDKAAGLKKPTQDKGKSNEKKQSTFIDYIFLILISLFIIIAPFYRGLFFRENYIPSLIIISLIYLAYIIYKFTKKDRKISLTYIDIAMISVPLCYFISFLFGVNAKEGLDAILIYIGYFIIYSLASNLAKGNKIMGDLIINGVIASTFITAFASLMTLAGKLDLNGVVLGNRLFGLYQYPNTTASVLAIGIILALNSINKTDDLKLKIIYQIVLVTLLPTFIFTLSRGGYLTLVGILLLNFFIIDALGKLNLIINTILPIFSTLLFIYRYFSKGQANYTNILNDYIISIVIVIALSLAFYTLEKRYLRNIQKRIVNIVLTSMVLIFATGLAFVISAKEPIEYKLEHKAGEEEGWKNKNFYFDDVEKEADYTLSYEVSSSVENKNSYRVLIRSYNSDKKHEDLFKETGPIGNDFEKREVEFTTLEDTERIRLYIYNHDEDSNTIYKDIVLKDSMGNIIKDYKKFKYIPEAIANRLVNIKLDTNSASSRIRFTKDGMEIFKDNILIGAGGGGWNNLYRQYQTDIYNTTETHNFYVQYAIEVGLLGLLSLAVIFIMLLMGFVKGVIGKSDNLHIYLAVILIFAHSAIDFNLSLTAVGFMLWLLVGVLNSDDNIMSAKELDAKWINAGLIAISILVLLITTSMYYGIKTGAKAADLFDSDWDNSMALYEKALKFDKYNSDYRMDYAQILYNKAIETGDSQYVGKMLDLLSEIKKHEPYNYKYVRVIINLMTAKGMLDEAVALAEEKVTNEPLLAGSYTLKVDLNYEIAMFYFDNKNHGKAIPYLERMIEAKEQFDEINSKLEKPMKLPKDYNMRTDLALNRIEWAKDIESKK